METKGNGGINMLTPELQKLKESLEGNPRQVDKEKLLMELTELDRIEMLPLCESLAKASTVCPTCGRKL